MVSKKKEVEDTVAEETATAENAAEERIPSQPAKLRWIPASVMLLCVGIFTALSMSALAPPSAVPSSASPAEFSSERAMNHVRAIAQTPRLIGSEGNAKARDHIISELSALGVTPEVQKTTLELHAAFSQVATLQNVVARLKGENSTHAVLLATHYDTLPNSPGAYDNAIGVATLIETLRALKSGPALKNDVILLFSDGRELGDIGAMAFMKHPWAKDAAVVLNFEAGGKIGPVFMLESTRSHGAWLMGKVAKAVEHPIATSHIYPLLQILSVNSTNMIAFNDIYEGYNFGNIRTRMSSDPRLDNIENFDERALQHNGLYALGLTREFGNVDLSNILPYESGNGVYFNPLGLTLINYPLRAAMPIALVILALFVGLVVIGIRRKHITIGGMLSGALPLLLSVIGVGAITFLAKLVITSLSPSFEMVGGNNVLFFGFVVMTIAVAAVIYSFYAKKLSVVQLAMGGLLFWLILTLGLSLFVAPVSYLFAWPLLASLIPMAYLFLSTKGQLDSTQLDSTPSLVLFTVCAIPGILLMIPALYTLDMALGLSIPEVLMILLTLLIGILVPHISLVVKAIPKRGALIAAAGVLAIVLLVVGVLTSDYRADYPKRDSLFYGLNADTGSAVWASSDASPDRWTSEFFSGGLRKDRLYEFFPVGLGEYLNSPAPAKELAPPSINLVGSSESNGVRRLQLRISSQRKASVIEITNDANEEILLAEVNGTKVTLFNNQLIVRYFGPPQEGLDLVLAVKSIGPFKLRVADYTYGITQSTGLPVKERPQEVVFSSKQMWKQNSAAVSKTYTF